LLESNHAVTGAARFGSTPLAMEQQR